MNRQWWRNLLFRQGRQLPWRELEDREMTTQTPMLEYNLLAEMRPDVDATVEAGLDVAGIPEYMHEGFLLYLRQGVIPGSFLTAILMNDFMAAAANADDRNQRALFAYARFLNNMPNACYGSRAKVEAWAKVGAERRRLIRDS